MRIRRPLSVPAVRLHAALAAALLSAALVPAAAEADVWVDQTLENCPADARALYESTPPSEAAVEWDRWVVSGSDSGSSDRFPEATPDFVLPRVLVENLETDQYGYQSLTGEATTDGSTTWWSAWWDREYEVCYLLRGTSPDQLTGDGASLTRSAPDRRTFSHGDRTFDLALDTSRRAEDQSKAGEGGKCKSTGDCKPNLECKGKICKKKAS